MSILSKETKEVIQTNLKTLTIIHLKIKMIIDECELKIQIN